VIPNFPIKAKSPDLIKYTDGSLKIYFFVSSQESGVVGAKHSENSLGQKLIIGRPNASPVQESEVIIFNETVEYH
ncbi:MAG: hypothetical protein ACKPA7_02640, partial [Sphaerospermopsis kisseleviana]